MEIQGLEEIKKEFDKFYNASPFVDRGEATRIAMQGAYMAGWTLLAEQFKNVAEEYEKKPTAQ